VNLVLWIGQWAFAVSFVLIALSRLNDAAQRRLPGESERCSEPLPSRASMLGYGLSHLVTALGLVSPLLPLAALHQRWVVPVAAAILAVTVLRFYLRYCRGAPPGWAMSILLLIIAVLRYFPFPQYR
jgi:hypothetical protein